jgi:hypothetical protein
VTLSEAWDIVLKVIDGTETIEDAMKEFLLETVASVTEDGSAPPAAPPAPDEGKG